MLSISFLVCEFISGGQLYPMNHEPVRRPPSVGLRGDPEQSCRQEQSVSKEQFVAEMLARPSNAESGRVRPQTKPRPHHDASPAQGRPQSDVSIVLSRQNITNI
jgi:hypothetical protein